MTKSVLGMSPTSLSSDKIRSSSPHLRHCLAELAERGKELWVGPLEDLLRVLNEVARVDLCLARLVEGHCDGLRIIRESGAEAGEGVYGVWASRSTGTGLKAEQVDGRWVLSGELRFASGVDLIDRALIPVWTRDGQHHLLDVRADLGVVDERVWQARGMDAARTFTVHVDDHAIQADQVGPDNFYLQRPGFVVGGLCVAAVWAGGAHHLLDLVASGIRDFPTTPHQLRRLGVMQQVVWQAETLVSSTVSRLSDLSADETAREILLTRTAVVRACETALVQSATIVGPGGLSRNARLARLIDDLGIYIRQHHVDSSLAELGETSLAAHELLTP